MRSLRHPIKHQLAVNNLSVRVNWSELNFMAGIHVKRQSVGYSEPNQGLVEKGGQGPSDK